MAPEVVHAGVFHHVERGGAECEAFDDTQPQHDDGVGDRGDA